jgi:hypothetical protein
MDKYLAGHPQKTWYELEGELTITIPREPEVKLEVLPAQNPYNMLEKLTYTDERGEPIRQNVL